MSYNAIGDDIDEDHDMVAKELDVQAQPRRLQAQGDEESLMRAFAAQQKRLKETVQDEFKKWQPLATRTAHSYKEAPKQGANVWSKFIPSSFEQQHNHDPCVIGTLVTKHNELQQQIAILQAANTELQGSCSSWKAQYDAARGKLAQERLKRAELESKTQSLRSMLVPAHERQLSDSEVLAKFISLRSQILKLVKTTWHHSLKSNWTLTEMQTKALRHFLNGKLDSRYLDSRVRSEVFSFLQKNILGVRTYALGEKNTVLDYTLGNVENFMWERLSDADYGSIIDWRIATMKMTADFRKDRHTLARAVQSAIWSFCEVLETRSDKSATEGLQMLEKICNDAVDLRLMMRSAKDEYHVDSVSGALEQPISKYEALVEEEASQPASSHDPETVAYLITGALIKFPNGDIEDRRVLEKAQAVVYR